MKISKIERILRLGWCSVDGVHYGLIGICFKIQLRRRYCGLGARVRAPVSEQANSDSLYRAAWPMVASNWNGSCAHPLTPYFVNSVRVGVTLPVTRHNFSLK